MRIHTDHLTRDDLRCALTSTGLTREGVWLDNLSEHGSRSRAHAYEVSLRADPGKDRNGKTRRAPNSGNHGADFGKAATYDEWGYWLAELFELDPCAVMTYYKSREDFHRSTRGAFVPASVLESFPDYDPTDAADLAIILRDWPSTREMTAS